MNKTVRRFPLAIDGEPVDNPPKTVALYENGDLITNIHGTYHERDYDDATRGYNFVGKAENGAECIETVSEDKSYAELTCGEARRDIEKKRQAYLSNNIKRMPSEAASWQQLKATLPKTPAKSTNKLSHLAEKMCQEDYILVEVPIAHEKPDNSFVPKPKENNYDFLRCSQVYNREVQQGQREHEVAQELDLTHFNDAN